MLKTININIYKSSQDHIRLHKSTNHKLPERGQCPLSSEVDDLYFNLVIIPYPIVIKSPKSLLNRLLIIY